MNKERMLELADYLEKMEEDAPHRFNMETWGMWLIPPEHRGQLGGLTAPRCSTAGCIAGHAIGLYDPNWRSKDVGGNDIPNRAQVLLGLTAEESSKLFLPWQENEYKSGDEYAEEDMDYQYVTASNAAEALRASAEAGSIEWPCAENVYNETMRMQEEED